MPDQFPSFPISFAPSFPVSFGITGGGLVESVAFVGDSITTYWGSGASYERASYGAWGRVLGGSNWDPVVNPAAPAEPYFASSGTRTDQHLSTYMPDAIASGAKVIFYHGGTNDGSAATVVQDSLDNVEDMIGLCNAAGATMILSTVMGPQPSASNPTKEAWVASFNTGIRSLASSYNLPLADFAESTETATPGQTREGLLDTQNLHPNSTCAYLMGEDVAAALSGLVSTSLGQDWLDNTPGAIFPSNYTFDDVTGNTPDRYRLRTTDYTSGTVTESIEARGDGNGNWWRLNGNSTDPTDTVTIEGPYLYRQGGNAVSGTINTVTFDTWANASTSLYEDYQVWITAGTGAGQTRIISDYTSGRVATVSEDWDTIPDATSVFEIGIQNAEEIVTFCEFEVISGDWRGIQLSGRVISPNSNTSSDVASSAISTETFVESVTNPTGVLILRGKPADLLPNVGGRSRIQLFIGGEFDIRIGRLGWTWLDR